jgi:hypothetical protein
MPKMLVDFVQRTELRHPPTLITLPVQTRIPGETLISPNAALADP